MVLKLMGMGRNGKAESHSRSPLLLIRTVDCSVLMIVRSSSFSLSTRNTGWWSSCLLGCHNSSLCFKLIVNQLLQPRRVRREPVLYTVSWDRLSLWKYTPGDSHLEKIWKLALTRTPDLNRRTSVHTSVWNSLPSWLRLIDSHKQFRWQLKTYYFNVAFS